MRNALTFLITGRALSLCIGKRANPRKSLILATTLCLLTGCSPSETPSDRAPASPPDPAPVPPAAVQPPCPPACTAPASTPAPEPAPAAPPPAPLVGRTWVSADGRKVDAELLSRTAETITIRRNSDQRHFTIALSTLSEADRTYVAASAIPLTHVKQFDLDRLNQLKKSIPALSSHAPLESTFPSLQDLFTKYRRNIESISPTGYARSVEMVKTDIEADLKRLEPVAATNLTSPPTYHPNYGWSKGSGAWREVWAARSAVSWLKGPLTRHINELEKLK